MHHQNGGDVHSNRLWESWHVSPKAKCPRCGDVVDFHEDEMDAVADGSGVCMDCRLQLTEDGYILGIAMGVVEPPPGIRDARDADEASE